MLKTLKRLRSEKNAIVKDKKNATYRQVVT